MGNIKNENPMAIIASHSTLWVIIVKNILADQHTTDGIRSIGHIINLK